MEQTYEQGYRLTTSADGLQIQPTTLAPGSLFLDEAGLAALGLAIQDRRVAYDPSQATRGRQVIESLIATLERISTLVASQTAPAEWKWDRENLQKLKILVGGLDEEGVAAILDEEG